MGIALVVLVACLVACNDSTTSPTGPIDAPHMAIDSHAQTSDGAMADVPGGTGEPAELMGMTLYHNQVRAMVDTTGVAGGPLPPMQWDPNLAALASAWVSQCMDTNNDGLVDHSSTQYRTNAAGYSYVGENIYASGGTATAQGAVQLWAAEKANYTYATNSCSGICGHYTQIVWRDSIHVGCALHDCPGLAYPSTIVCNYGPGGNYGGQSPY
jgi:pathogenesis-related protein 1